MQMFTALLSLWAKCNADIFFVDWERPKAFDNHSIVKNTIETPTISSEVYCTAIRKNCLVTYNCISQGKLLMFDGVSAWRTYFVANEWLRLATRRRTSMRVQMVAVISASLVKQPNNYLKLYLKPLYFMWILETIEMLFCL